MTQWYGEVPACQPGGYLPGQEDVDSKSMSSYVHLSGKGS